MLVVGYDFDFIVSVAVVTHYNDVSVILDPQFFELVEHCANPTVQVLTHSQPDCGIIPPVDCVGMFVVFFIPLLYQWVIHILFVRFIQAFITRMHGIMRYLKIKRIAFFYLFFHEANGLFGNAEHQFGIGHIFGQAPGRPLAPLQAVLKGIAGIIVGRTIV